MQNSSIDMILVGAYEQEDYTIHCELGNNAK